jgi:spermidine synthase
MHGIRSVVFSRETEFQKIDIVDSVEYGRMLLQTGRSSRRSATSLLPRGARPPGDALAAGVWGRADHRGGGGGRLREVLRHPSVRRAVMVRHRRRGSWRLRGRTCRSSRRGHSTTAGGSVIGDGRRYVEDGAGEGQGGQLRRDILDVTDPLEGGPGALLYTKEFYALASGR